MSAIVEKKALVYTDGACSGNPGPGGWSWVCLGCGEIREAFGGEVHTTNNRMELQAAAQGLISISARIKSGELDGYSVEVHTDSQYVKNGVSTWIASWKRNGWKTANKSPVKNRDLWEQLDALATETKANFVWVKGHAGELWNERCDVLARKGVEQASGKPY